MACELQMTVMHHLDNVNFKADSSFLQFFWMQQLTRKGKSAFIFTCMNIHTFAYLFLPPVKHPMDF